LSAAADTAFRTQIERDALALGWAPDVARALAKHVGVRVPTAAMPKPKALILSLDRAVRLFDLPATTAAQFRAAGVMTAEAATPLLRSYFRRSVRDPAAARAALSFDLIARKQWKKGPPRDQRL
jgi:hypothetical protein